MKYLKLVMIAFALVAFVSCGSDESGDTGNNSKNTEQTKEKGKTKVDLDVEKGEAGYEDENVDVNVDLGDKKDTSK